MADVEVPVAPPEPDSEVELLEPSKVVPWQRFVSVVEKKNAYKAEIAGLAAENARLKTVASEAEARFTAFTAVASELGVTDPDSVDAVLWHHGRLPADGRPPVGEWLSGLRAAPETAPAMLRPFFSAAPAKSPAPPAPPPPRAPGAGAQAPGAPAAYSPAELQRAAEDAMRSGNYAKLREMRRLSTTQK